MPGAVPVMLIMPPQQIGREIMPGVVPHRMDVVGVVLRVVVLDQQMGTVQPLVMRPARLGAACPGEMDML